MGTLIYTIKTSMGRIQPASWPYLEIGMGSGKGAEGASPWCGLGRLWEGLAAQQQVACRQKAGLGSRPALPESRPQGQHALGGEGGRGLKAWRGDWDTRSWGSPPPPPWAASSPRALLLPALLGAALSRPLRQTPCTPSSPFVPAPETLFKTLVMTVSKYIAVGVLCDACTPVR